MPGPAKPSPAARGLDDAPCGYLVFDDKGIILETNNKLRDWLELTPDELDRLPVTRIFSVASRIVFETSIAPLLTLNGRVDGASLDLLAGNGAKVPVLLSAQTSESGARRLTTLVLLLADARRNFERELANARIEAETSLSTTQREGELREQFIAILGHDLRNPLASISSAVRMLGNEPLSDRGREIIKLTQGSVQRMALLITNVLDFTRNRLGGGIKLDLTEGRDLEGELRQVVDELRSTQPDRDIRLEISTQESVRCDVGRVGQLLSNLLGNALTYGDAAEPVHVVSRRTQDGMFELSVRNGGEPIPPAEMERLFDPFVRSTNHEDPKGLGLGLYIASAIAKAHGGTLDVSSDVERTIFTFRMQGDGPGI